jgi:hypothetical protein
MLKCQLFTMGKDIFCFDTHKKLDLLVIGAMQLEIYVDHWHPEEQL